MQRSEMRSAEGNGDGGSCTRKRHEVASPSALHEKKRLTYCKRFAHKTRAFNSVRENIDRGRFPIILFMCCLGFLFIYAILYTMYQLLPQEVSKNNSKTNFILLARPIFLLSRW